jgi:ParB family chromosome partitioning protein
VTDAARAERLPEDALFHPVANIFPLMGEAELAELADDIRANGLREPIWRHPDGRIVDGRNCWLACQKVGVEPLTRTYEGDEAELVPFVVSLNLHRRHLDESQRAMVAAKLATLGHGQKKADSQILLSQSEAAELLNVSVGSVKHARKVQQDGAPALIAAVDQGFVAVSTAAEIAREFEPEAQQEIVARGEAEILRVAKEIRARKLPHTQLTGEYEWYTPGEYLDAAREVLGGIDLDPASSEGAQRVVRAARYYTAETDGLAQPWRGRVWLNPPYARGLIENFVDKLLAEHQAGNVPEAVLLVENRTDTRWFHGLAKQAAAVCFTLGRIQFRRPDGTGENPITGSCFVYLGSNPSRFAEIFGGIGHVLYNPLHDERREFALLEQAA